MDTHETSLNWIDFPPAPTWIFCTVDREGDDLIHPTRWGFSVLVLQMAKNASIDRHYTTETHTSCPYVHAYAAVCL